MITFKLILKRIFDKQSRILIKNSSWVLLENFIRTVFTFIRSIIVARGLGVELYGVFAIVVAFVGTVQEFFNMNVGTTIIKFGAKYKTENRSDKLAALLKGSLYITLLSSMLSIILVTILLLVSYSTFISKPGLFLYTILYAVVFSTMFFDYISSSLLRLYFKFKINSIIRIITGTIEFIVVSATVIIFPRNLHLFFTSVIVSTLINTLINNGMAFWELRGELRPYLGTGFNVIKNDLKEIVGFTIGNSLSKTVKTLMDKGDTLLLGVLAGPVQVGYYTVAKKLAFSFLRLTNPMANSVFPQLSLLISEKRTSDIKKMIFRMTKYISFIGSLFFFVVCFFRDEIIYLFYGSEYIKAASSFLILLMIAVLNGSFFWNLSIIQSLGLMRIRFFTYIFALVFELFAIVLLIPVYGSAGVAIGLLISNIIIICSFTYFSMKNLEWISI